MGSTQLSEGFLAGLDFASPSLRRRPLVAENLRTLVALVLVFKKRRVATA
jgi:hypothetical protein